MTVNINDLNLHPNYEKKLQEVLNRILEHKEEMCLEEVLLFGSVARKDYNMSSDIDICLVTKGQSRYVSFLAEKFDIRDDIDYPNVDVIVRTRKSLSSAEYYINTLIERDKIVLWKEDINCDV